MKKIRLFIILVIFYSIEVYLISRFGYLASGIAFLILLLPCYIFAELENKYRIILFSLPFAAIIKINASWPSFLLLLMVILIVDYYLKTRGKISITGISIIILFCISQLMTIHIYNAEFYGILSFIFNIVFMITMFEYFSNKYNESKMSTYTSYYILGVLASIVLAFIFPGVTYYLDYSDALILSQIGRFSGLNVDPNYYSQIVLVALAFILTNIKNEKLTFKLSSIFIFLSYSGLLSKSKSFIITYTLLILIFFSYRYFDVNRKKIRNFLSELLLIIIVLMMLIIFINSIMIPLFEERTDSRDFSNGRLEIFEKYYDMIKNEPQILLIGLGASNSEKYIAKYIGKNKASHNVYIELISDTGILGIILIIILFKTYFGKNKLKLNNINILFIYPIMITSFALSMSSNDLLYAILPLVFLIDNY